mmetsp:Transcript_28451/g.60267  ORF Transcript_28451/g.60267 Transcript_28451/m.60267 type:complete len:228 (+) Transcript_28451:435-1118(+)
MQLSRTTSSSSPRNCPRIASHSPHLSSMAPKASALSCLTILCSFCRLRLVSRYSTASGCCICPKMYATSCLNRALDLSDTNDFPSSLTDSTPPRLRSENMARYRSNSGADSSVKIAPISADDKASCFGCGGAGSTEEYGLSIHAHAMGVFSPSTPPFIFHRIKSRAKRHVSPTSTDESLLAHFSSAGIDREDPMAPKASAHSWRTIVSSASLSRVSSNAWIARSSRS